MTMRKWFVPLSYFVLFSFCSFVAGAWGLAVRSPHPPLRDMPLLPSAADLVDRSPTNVVASRTPVAARDPFLTNFQFVTNDSPEVVVAFYKGSMTKLYGFVGEWTESPSPGTTIIHFGRRAFRDIWVEEMKTESVGSTLISTPTLVLRKGWTTELVTVTITSEGTSPTTVNVDLRVQPEP
jgi:hypothetical protein